MSVSYYTQKISPVQYASRSLGGVIVFSGVCPGVDDNFDLSLCPSGFCDETGFDIIPDYDGSFWEGCADYYAHGAEPSEERSGASTDDGGATVRGLSMAHISPFTPTITYLLGASVVRVVGRRPESNPNNELCPGGRRGLATFSSASRRRLKAVLASVKRSALPVFVTLTYPSEFPLDSSVYKSHLDTFFKRLRRVFPGASAVWKLEPQRRGAPHYHLFLWGVDDRIFDFVPSAWYDIAGNGDEYHLLWHRGELPPSPDGTINVHCVQQVRNFRGVFSYAAKYMSKKVDNFSEYWESVGRWWGVMGRKFLPVGLPVRFAITYKMALDLIRLQRKTARYPIYKTIFSKSKGRRVRVLGADKKPVILKFRSLRSFSRNTSLRIFTDADAFMRSVSSLIFPI